MTAAGNNQIKRGGIPLLPRTGRALGGPRRPSVPIEAVHSQNPTVAAGSRPILRICVNAEHGTRSAGHIAAKVGNATHSGGSA